MERGEVDETESWKSYVEFNEHAIEEIGNGTLDHWFSPPPSQNMSDARRIDADSLEHAEQCKVGFRSAFSPTVDCSLNPR